MTSAPAPDIFFSQTHRLFDVLSDAQRDEIRRALTVLEMKRGSRIYKPGDLAHHVYWVWSGVVKLGTPAPDGSLLVRLSPTSQIPGVQVRPAQLQDPDDVAPLTFGYLATFSEPLQLREHGVLG